MSLLQKASRLPSVARDGWRYPALRMRARGVESAVGVLRGLGFATDELEAAARDFDTLAPGLYAQLAERARQGGSEVAETRASGHSDSSEEGKRLLYLSVRVLRPQLLAETGPFNGASTAFLLRALEDNGAGRLLTFDLQEATDALGIPLPAGQQPAWLVPDELRPRLELVLGDTRRTLGPRLRDAGKLDLFFHDSLHTARHMLFEFRAAWRHLRPGGVLLADDVFWNPAFWAFTRFHRVPFRHIGTIGATRKG